MKKAIFTIFICLLSFSYASSNSSVSEAQKINEFKNKINVKLIYDKIDLFKNASKYLGITKAKEMQLLDSAIDNRYFIKALYYNYQNLAKTKIRNKTFNFPDYPKILSTLNKGLKKTNNPLYAYYGLKIIINNYMASGKTGMSNLYLRKFSKKLKDLGYCIGYLYEAKSYLKEYSDTYDYEQAYSLAKDGYQKCKNNKKIYHFLISGLGYTKSSSYVMLKFSK